MSEPPERSTDTIGRNSKGTNFESKGNGYFHPKRKSTKKKKLVKTSAWRWVITITGWTFAISVVLSAVSSSLMSSMSVFFALFVLLFFICVGIFFDIIGVAVTASDEKPFHSMASRRVAGALQALKLLRNAEKVSNFCNDVVGDIAGIISGTTVSVVVNGFVLGNGVLRVIVPVAFSALVASLTVGGKALGKSIAMRYNVEIVHIVGRFMSFINGLKTKMGIR